MERYWDCSLCRIDNRGRARRCRGCSGRLQGRDRLLWEAVGLAAMRRRAGMLSAVAAGLGQIYARRWVAGLVLGVLLPLALGLVFTVWSGFSYGHLFLLVVAIAVLVVAAFDARTGPRTVLAPCQETCPAGVAIPDYLQLILDGETEQGFGLIRSRIPLVGTIGRVCPHPCEDRCVRGVDGEPIAINGCKRFLADEERARRRKVESPGRGRAIRLEGGGPSVGVVGGGPAGLACAYYLGVLGASVTVYEAGERMGGRLATTIPDYRLPPVVLEHEVDDLRSEGVSLVTGQRVGPGGRSVAALLDEHQGLFLGVGASMSVPLEVPGHELFLDFQVFLEGAKRGVGAVVGRRVAVVGGGNAAIDVCRSLLRLGTEAVHLVYRRGRDQMPARSDEVVEAEREGVRFHLLADPVEARVDGGRVCSLVLRRMRLGAPDASGRPRPEPVAGDTWELAVDAVIPALGQRVSGGVFDDPALADLAREPDGRIRADLCTQRTNLPRIYAGGDAVSGPATAVAAMAQGRRAALALFAELAGGRVSPQRLRDRRLRLPFPGHKETLQARIREEMPRLGLRTRTGTFAEVEEGFRDTAACREGGRCLQCHREL